MLLLQLPPEILSSIVFVTLLNDGTGDAREERRRKVLGSRQQCDAGAGKARQAEASPGTDIC